jgi:hypothetical protein
MDKKTFEALKIILAFTKNVNDPRPHMTPDAIWPEIEAVEGWMQEVEKEIDD